MDNKKSMIELLLNRKENNILSNKILTKYTNKIILITGASGFVGSEFCKTILKAKPKLLIAVDINENSLYSLELELRDKKLIKDNFISLICSIRDYNALKYIFKSNNPDIVIHTAAHKHVPLMEKTPIEAINNNIIGTENLIKLSTKYKVKTFVAISTDKAVEPTTVMGATKRFMEFLLQAASQHSKTKFITIRFCNILGSSGSVIPIFERQISENLPLTLTDKKMTRYFITAQEAVNITLQLCIEENAGLYIIDGGKAYKIIDIANNLLKYYNKKLDIIEVGLRPGEKLDEILFSASEQDQVIINDFTKKVKRFKVSRAKLNKAIIILLFYIKFKKNPLEIKNKLLTLLNKI